MDPHALPCAFVRFAFYLFLFWVVILLESLALVYQGAMLSGLRLSFLNLFPPNQLGTKKKNLFSFAAWKVKVEKGVVWVSVSAEARRERSWGFTRGSSLICMSGLSHRLKRKHMPLAGKPALPCRVMCITLIGDSESRLPLCDVLD